MIASEDEDGDPDHVEVIPRLKTVTRHGRIAGTWQTRFQLSNDDSDSDSESDSDTEEPPPIVCPNPTKAPKTNSDNIVVTRSGRRATSWKGKK